MKSSPNATAPRNNNNASHPPLARNAQGHPIALPDGTASFMIKRETGGRPQVIKGPDGHPYRLPLAATDQDLRYNFGAGTFRLDALDALGNVLDYVTTVRIADNESEEHDDEDHDDGHDGRGGDALHALRCALQTIDRMTRAQSDAIRAVTEAQADWVKGLAVAKSLPRNAMYLPAPAQVERADRDDDDDDDDRGAPQPAVDPPPPPAPPGWAADFARNVGPMVAPALQDVASTLMKRFMGSSQESPATPTPTTETTTPAAGATPRPVAATPNPMIHLAQINAGITDDERMFLGAMLQSPRGETLTAELLALSVDDAIDEITEGFAQVRADKARARAEARARARAETNARAHSQPRPDPETTGPAANATHEAATASSGDFATRVRAVAALLDAAQCVTVLALLPRLAPQRREQLEAQLLAMSDEEAAAWIRANLPALCAEVEK